LDRRETRHTATVAERMSRSAMEKALSSLAMHAAFHLLSYSTEAVD
jgi:hypothetical protein